MSIYDTTEHFYANSGSEIVDTWYGTEVQYASGYNEAKTVVTGGTYHVTGAGAGSVTIVASGVHGGPLETEWPYGDYGYYCHVQHAVGGAEFDLNVICQYVA